MSTCVLFVFPDFVYQMEETSIQGNRNIVSYRRSLLYNISYIKKRVADPHHHSSTKQDLLQMPLFSTTYSIEYFRASIYSSVDPVAKDIREG